MNKKHFDTYTEEERQAHLAGLEKTLEIMESGFAGVDKNGAIVDRREHPKAVPCEENKAFRTPKPKRAAL